MNTKHNASIFAAILAAALYAISTPISKILLNEIPPTLMAALLYLGAGLGMAIIGLYLKINKSVRTENKLTKAELPFITGMIILDIAAPILLMFGLALTTPENASLLNNFEIVATSLIALFLFKETVTKRLWFAIALITISSIILSVEDINSSLSFSYGSLFIVLACISWGLENNCTRKLSVKDPLQIVVIKGMFSGTGSLIIALTLGEYPTSILYTFIALILGFVAYGLSIFFYVLAQRELGAAKTSTYYAIAPFIGAGLSLLIFKQIPATSFFIALFIMIIGTYFASTDSKSSEIIP